MGSPNDATWTFNTNSRQIHIAPCLLWLTEHSYYEHIDFKCSLLVFLLSEALLTFWSEQQCSQEDNPYFSNTGKWCNDLQSPREQRKEPLTGGQEAKVLVATSWLNRWCMWEITLGHRSQTFQKLTLCHIHPMILCVELPMWVTRSVLMLKTAPIWLVFISQNPHLSA